MIKELSNHQKAINEAVAPLIPALLQSKLVKSVIIDKREGRFLTVEHENGTVFTVYPRFIGYTVFNGYSLSQPIVPNTHTGSSVSLVGNDENYDAGFSLIETIEVIENGLQYMPNFFSTEAREKTNHQTWHAVRLSWFHRDDTQLKGEEPSDRDMVNSCIAQDKSYKNSYLQEVSEEFVEEMRDCLPPAFMGVKDCFYYIQVGEATAHKEVNGEWVEVYETYVKATAQNEFTVKYAPDQWYFMGVYPLLK